MLVGDGYIEEVLAVPVVGDDIITDKELSHLHKFLSQTMSNQQVRSADYLGMQSITACNDTCIRGD